MRVSALIRWTVSSASCTLRRGCQLSQDSGPGTRLPPRSEERMRRQAPPSTLLPTQVCFTETMHGMPALQLCGPSGETAVLLGSYPQRSYCNGGQEEDVESIQCSVVLLHGQSNSS